MSKRIISFILASVFATLILSGGASAISIAVTVGDEDLYNLTPTNAAGTASYDYDNNILTLTNYNGGPISYVDDGGPLTIILNGTNTITSNYDYEGILSYDSITLQGSGSLSINNTPYGIYLYGGDLTLNNASAAIKNVSSTGIVVNDGNFTLNSNLTIDSSASEIEADLGYFDGFQAINVRNNVEINGNLTIKNAASGIATNGSIAIKSGNSSISTAGTGIQSAKSFTMQSGKLDIQVTKPEDFWGSLYGIKATGLIDIKGGELHVLAPDDEIAVVVYDEDGETPPNITITSPSKILPLGNQVIDVDLIEYVLTKTIGKSADDIANEVTIKVAEPETNPNTSDDIISNIFIIAISAASLTACALLARKQ